MSKNFKHFTLEFPGDEHIEKHISLKDNDELYTNHKQLILGQRLYLVDTNLIDQFTNKYSKIAVECIYIEQDPKFPNEVWYYFRAVADEDLNTLNDPKFQFLYYRILESTSPYIIVV